MYQRSASSDINPAVQAKAKPILRNVNSDAGPLSSSQSPNNKGQIRPMSLIEQYEQHVTSHNLPEPLSPLVIEHTNLDSTTILTEKTRQNNEGGGQNCHDFVNQRKVSNDDSLVQIYVPPNDHNNEDSSSDDDTLSVDSQLPDNDQPVNHVTSSKKTEVKRTLSAEVASRKIPPMLSDWQVRSQSFPPPKGPFSIASSAASEADAGFHSDGLQESMQEKSVTESSLSVKNNDHDGKTACSAQCDILQIFTLIMFCNFVFHNYL